MDTSCFTNSQIIAILKQAEGGTPIPELCREHGISNATFYKWCAKFGGMMATTDEDDGDLSDMLGELRVLLPSAQLLSAFLITVPFAPGFASVVAVEKHVFLATFVLSVAALVLFSAPAVQHRLVRPLSNRTRFKHIATRQILAGAGALSLALVLATQLVLSSVLGHTQANLVAGFVAVLILALWWVLPKAWRASGRI